MKPVSPELGQGYIETVVVGRIISVNGDIISSPDREMEEGDIYISCIVRGIGEVETKVFSMNDGKEQRRMMTDVTRDIGMVAKIECIIYEAERLYSHINLK